MLMGLLSGAPRRAPFTDWCAQIERLVARRSNDTVVLDRRNQALKAAYDCGLSPQEIVDDFVDWKAKR